MAGFISSSSPKCGSRRSAWSGGAGEDSHGAPRILQAGYACHGADSGEDAGALFV